jgi:hypothetical protein
MQWISVKERLPESTQRCWIYGHLADHSSCKCVFSGYFIPKKALWELDNDLDETFRIRLHRVYHWMPYYYPAPPE